MSNERCPAQVQTEGKRHNQTFAMSRLVRKRTREPDGATATSVQEDLCTITCPPPSSEHPTRPLCTPSEARVTSGAVASIATLVAALGSPGLLTSVCHSAGIIVPNPDRVARVTLVSTPNHLLSALSNSELARIVDVENVYHLPIQHVPRAKVESGRRDVFYCLDAVRGKRFLALRTPDACLNPGTVYLRAHEAETTKELEAAEAIISAQIQQEAALQALVRTSSLTFKQEGAPGTSAFVDTLNTCITDCATAATRVAAFVRTLARETLRKRPAVAAMCIRCPSYAEGEPREPSKIHGCGGGGGEDGGGGGGGGGGSKRNKTRFQATSGAGEGAALTEHSVDSDDTVPWCHVPCGEDDFESVPLDVKAVETLMEQHAGALGSRDPPLPARRRGV